MRVVTRLRSLRVDTRQVIDRKLLAFNVPNDPPKRVLVRTLPGRVGDMVFLRASLAGELLVHFPLRRGTKPYSPPAIA